MIRILFVVAVLGMTMAMPPAVQAQQAEPPIGMILDVEGEGATVTHALQPDKPVSAHIQDKVYRNDILQTGANGRMLVVLIDDSRFTLGEKAQFKVDDYAYDDKDDRANTARYSVLQGAFLYTSGLLTKKENPDVKIATPYGSIGIRGTSLWGGNLGSQYGVYVDEGEVSLETKRGHIVIGAGNATSISAMNAIPERPKPLADEIVAAAKQTVALNHIDDIKTRMEKAREDYPAMIAAHKEFIHAERLQQLDNPASTRSRNRGVLKIEQDRQDERLKAQGVPDTTVPTLAPLKPAEAEKKPAPAQPAPPAPATETPPPVKKVEPL